VFTLLGLGASSLGAALNRYKLVLQGLGALLILVFGLKFLGLIRIPWLDRVVKADDTRYQTRFGALNALVMGVVFAAGWTPCVGPVLGSVLSYTASVSSSPWTGAGYLAVYGAGFALPLLITAVFAEAGLRLLDRIKPHLPRIERIIGALLVVVALGMVWDLAQGYAADDSRAVDARHLTTDAQGQRVPAMVELYSSNCSICKQMKPIVNDLVEQCHGKNVLVRTVNVSEGSNRALAKRYRLVGVPTFLFLDKEGKEVARLVGRQTPEALRQALSALRGERCPGVGPLPDEMRDRPLAFPERKQPQEVETCHSTSITATTVTKNSNPSSRSKSATRPSAPSAERAPGVCSAGSPSEAAAGAGAAPR
jgi:cytochrome c-type biogenesis protein